jgi:hypothetical protein
MPAKGNVEAVSERREWRHSYLPFLRHTSFRVYCAQIPKTGAMTVIEGLSSDDRDFADMLISILDIESQLFAITALLSRNDAAEAEATARIKELEDWARTSTGTQAERAVDLWVDEMHYSVFTDATSSMAAIGMFMPLLESIFTQTFRTLGEMYQKSGRANPDHKRWKRPNPNDLNRWHAQTYFGSDTPSSDLFPGIKQLAEASGLKSYLDDADMALLEALTFYRNRMFHMGLEWPLDSRKSFWEHATKKGWSDYFTISTTGGEPWIIYLSPGTIRALTPFVDRLIGQIGRFAKDLPPDLYAS